MGTKAKLQVANHIPLTAVDSSRISRIGFDGNTNTLAIEFIGNAGEDKVIYHYYNVTPAAFQQFSNANSLGNYFHNHVKGHFDYQKIEPETELRKNITADGAVEQQEVDEPQAA